MEQQVRVTRVCGDGTAEVLCIRESACSGDCHKCSGCGAVQQKMLLPAVNAIGAEVGDLVILKTESKPVLKAAAMLYLMPMGLFLLSYIAGDALWHVGGLTGAVGFVLGILAAVFYDRKVVKKQNTTYTITGFSEKNRKHP